MDKVIKDIQDLRFLNWDKNRNSSGTAGSFLKSYSLINGVKVYYKLSNFDVVNGITGHECINDIIIDRLFCVLGVPHLSYKLIHASINIQGENYETYLCSSLDFKKKGEQKKSLDTFYALNKLNKETPFDFCIRYGFEKYIYEMLVVDFLILNRDRHGANIEVLIDLKENYIRLAPLFDHGISLLSRCINEDQIIKYDVMDDKRIQCFIGSSSSKDNLNLIPKDKLPKLNKLKEEDKEYLFKDLDKIISENLINKIWEMIYKRWCYYEDFCNKK